MPPLPQRPKVLDRFTVIPIGPNEVRLHSHSDSLCLTSHTPELLSRLLPLLDGDHHLNEILHDLQTMSKERVVSTLEELMAAGVLEDAGAIRESILSPSEIERYRDQLTFFSHFALPTQDDAELSWPDIPVDSIGYQERLKAACVLVYGLGRLGSQLVRALAVAGVGRIIGMDAGYVTANDVHSDAWYGGEEMGIPRVKALGSLVACTNPWVTFTPLPERVRAPEELAFSLREATFAVLCSDQYKPDLYDVFNLACLQADTTWTSCRLLGFEFDIGPTVIPHKTPCFHCFELRQKSNITDYEEHLLLEHYIKRNDLTPCMLTITPGIGMTALEVVKALTEFMEPVTYAHLISLDLLNLECQHHPILKIPHCPHCGRPSQGRPSIQIWDWEQVQDQENGENDG